MDTYVALPSFSLDRHFLRMAADGEALACEHDTTAWYSSRNFWAIIGPWTEC